MKIMLAGAFVVSGLLMSVPLSAAPLGNGANLITTRNDLTEVQYMRGGSRDFRQCMRAKYGPRYFSRVPRAHRFHMAQACGG